MKKLTFIVAFFAMASFVFADLTEGPLAVSLNINGEGAYNYRINTAVMDNELTQDFQDNIQLSSVSLGTPTSLILTGGVAVMSASSNQWGEEKFEVADAFALQYRVYPVSEGEKEWNASDIGWNTIPLNQGNSRKVGDVVRGEDFSQNIDILAQANAGSGSYYFDIRVRFVNYWNNTPYTNYSKEGWDLTERVTFTVQDNRPVASFDVPFTAIFSGASVVFTNTSTNASTYSWNFGDGATSTEMNPVHNYSSPGTYTVELRATNSFGSRNFEKVMHVFEQSTTDNKIVGGDMTDASKWIIAMQGKTQPVYTWNSTDAPTGANTALRITRQQSGDGFALYQPVYLEANSTYIFDCLVKDLGNNVSNTWMQLFITDAVQPNDDSDIILNPATGENSNIGQLNSWNENLPAGFDGSFLQSAQKGSEYVGEPSKFVPTVSGMYYLILRIGTWYGTGMDISISNLSLTKDDGGTTNLLNPEAAIKVNTSLSENQITVVGAQSSVELFTVSGKRVISERAFTETILNTASLSNGVYLLVVDNKYTYKVIR